MSTAHPDVTGALAALVTETRGAALPVAAIESARLRFLDTLGVMVAGTATPVAAIARAHLDAIGGRAEASVAGASSGAPAMLAGFANAVAAHALEYDDYTKGVTHASVCMVPGTLAVAEAVGASGRALLEAFVIGFEVEARVGQALRPRLFDRGWHPNGILGAWGVAAAAARLKGLDATQTRMAFGLAASSGSGIRRNVGSMGKPFHVGHGVRCGIEAAELAARGFRVHPNALESDPDAKDGHDRFGMADTYNGLGQHRLHLALEEIGTRWELARDTTVVRFHPGATGPSAAIDAIIDLARQHDIAPDSVAAIEAEVTGQVAAIGSYTSAGTGHEARFCLPYIFAVALLDRAVGPAQYTDARVRAADVQALMRRVSTSVPPDLARHHGQWGEGGINWGICRILVRLTDGRELRTARDTARGWSRETAGWADIRGKFDACCEGVIPRARRDALADAIAGIEALPDCRALARLLAAAA